MTNRERFYEAFAHAGHRVMGRDLEVFTLRHRFWLEAFGSPLVLGGAVTLVDLEMAAGVCALPVGVLDREVPRMLTRGPSLMAKLRFCWRVLRRRADAEYEAFQDYMLDHGCAPATHGAAAVSHDGRNYETMPGILGLVTGLVRGSGWDPDTVWALSPGQAEWYLTGIFMHRGVDMRLKTAHDEEFEEGIRRERVAAQARKSDMSDKSDLSDSPYEVTSPMDHDATETGSRGNPEAGGAGEDEGGMAGLHGEPDAAGGDLGGGGQ